MTYYINPLWFYLMNMSHKLVIFCAMLGAVLIICGIVYAIELSEGVCTENEELAIKKRLKLSFIFGLLTIMISIFLPDKETCIEMMVASQVTHENVEVTKEGVYEIVDYVMNKIKEE